MSQMSQIGYAEYKNPSFSEDCYDFLTFPFTLVYSKYKTAQRKKSEKKIREKFYVMFNEFKELDVYAYIFEHQNDIIPNGTINQSAINKYPENFNDVLLYKDTSSSLFFINKKTMSKYIYTRPTYPFTYDEVVDINDDTNYKWYKI